jgi:hypothetical protein
MPRDSELPLRWQVAAIAIMFTVVLGCRVGHWICLLNGIRNEDRSLMIGNLEVHHITWSTLVLWLLVGVKQRAGRFTVPLALAAAAILGSMSDEFAYMLHVGHIVENDNFYSSAWSLLGAGFTAAAVAVAIGIHVGNPETGRGLCSTQSKG